MHPYPISKQSTSISNNFISEPDIEGFIVDIKKIFQYQSFLVIFDIEFKYLMSKVVYSISEKPSIWNALISKKPSILGVARFQMHSEL
jgi:hypothetical protein